MDRRPHGFPELVAVLGEGPERVQPFGEGERGADGTGGQHRRDARVGGRQPQRERRRDRVADDADRPAGDPVQHVLRLADPVLEIEEGLVGLAARAPEPDQIHGVDVVALGQGLEDQAEVAKRRGARSRSVHHQERRAAAPFEIVHVRAAKPRAARRVARKLRMRGHLLRPPFVLQAALTRLHSVPMPPISQRTSSPGAR